MERVRPILSGLAELNLHIHAVLDGQTPGVVYVDQPVQPQSAFLVSGDGVYLAGASDNDGFNWAVNALLPRDTYFVLFCDPNRWAVGLETVLEGTYAIRTSRRYYVFDQPQITNWRAQVDEGFSMCHINADLLSQDLKKRDSVVAGILGEWQTVGLFLEQGFGLCLVSGPNIVTWSLADFVSDDRCEIGITTDWDYRKRGFGTLTAAASAEHAVDRGYATIGWHCWDNNAGSIGVAENVGFRQMATYDVFINHWAAENITDMTQEEFRAFADAYEQELDARPPESGFPHIVTAKAWGLSGNREGCFRHLNKAVTMGWLRDVDHLRELWPELWFNPNLEEMQAWQDFVSRFGKRHSKQ
jgi:GNAT superfamily N-acetyltransferase